MTETTLITAKHQVTLPKRVRQALGAGVGDRLAFVKGRDGSWHVLAIPKDPVKALMMAGKGLGPADLAKLHEEYERAGQDPHRE